MKAFGKIQKSVADLAGHFVAPGWRRTVRGKDAKCRGVLVSLDTLKTKCKRAQKQDVAEDINELRNVVESLKCRRARMGLAHFARPPHPRPRLRSRAIAPRIGYLGGLGATRLHMVAATNSGPDASLRAAGHGVRTQVVKVCEHCRHNVGIGARWPARRVSRHTLAAQLQKRSHLQARCIVLLAQPCQVTFGFLRGRPTDRRRPSTMHHCKPTKQT